MIKKLTGIAASAVSAFTLGTFIGVAPALGAGDAGHVEDVAFSFEGPFGTYDTHQLQRGLQVYTEICAGCHGMKFVPIRTLADKGGPELPADQMRAYAANNLPEIIDKETGEERPRKPSDMFPQSALENAPDLSLIAKARAGFHGPYGLGINQLFNGTGGPEYIHAFLAGYTGKDKEEAGVVYYENTVFPGHWTAMPPPLSDDMVSYADGHAASVEHMAEDVSAFLMWAAEPKMAERKTAGFKAVVFLILLSSLLYLTNKRLWAGIKRKTA